MSILLLSKLVYSNITMCSDRNMLSQQEAKTDLAQTPYRDSVPH